MKRLNIGKKTLFVFFILIQANLFVAQAPPQINYQGLARDAMGIPVTSLSTIGLQFIITNGANIPVHTENQPNVPISNLGLFNTKIGLSPAISNTITWQNGPYNLEVSINLGAGLVALGKQQLVSVPYALYAEKSGATISQSLTINGNSLSITGGNTIALPTGTGSTLINLTYTPSTGVLSYSPAQFSNTLNISPSISFTNDVLTVGSNTTQITAGGLWSKPNPTVTALTFSNDYVGIGTNNPAYSLDVVSPFNTFIQAKSTGNGPVGIIIDRANSSLGGYFVNRTSGLDDWVTGELGGSIDYHIHNWLSARTDIFINYNSGNVGMGTVNPNNRLAVIEFTNPSSAIFGSNSATLNSPSANGVQGLTNSTHTLAAGVFGESTGSGPGIFGRKNNSIGNAGLFEITNAANNSAAVRAAATVGNAIFATNSSAGSPAVFAQNSSAAFAIHAFNSGTGNSLFANKTAGATGAAAYFENLTPNNTSEVVIVANNSTVSSSPGLNLFSNTASAPIAMQVNNGHIKSVAANPPTFTTSAFSGGFTAPTATTMGAGSTDIKGNFSFITDATGFAAINFCDIQIRFTKPYGTNPTVVVTPTSDLMALSFMVSAISLNTFTVRIYKPNGVGFPITLGSTTFRFNYIVIE